MIVLGLPPEKYDPQYERQRNAFIKALAIAPMTVESGKGKVLNLGSAYLALHTLTVNYVDSSYLQGQWIFPAKYAVSPVVNATLIGSPVNPFSISVTNLTSGSCLVRVLGTWVSTDTYQICLVAYGE